MTGEDNEEAHFFAFVAHNTKEHGQDKLKLRRGPPQWGTGETTAEDVQSAALPQGIQPGT